MTDAVIQELEQTIERQARDLEYYRRVALQFDDSARPRDIAQALEEGPLRRWPSSWRQEFADRILRPF